MEKKEASVRNDISSNEQSGKNVIVTVLSTVRNRNNSSYYWVKSKCKKLYCDGICSITAGTKYFLSKNNIDKIIVVTSDETRSMRNGKLSDYIFFKNEIKKYINGKSAKNSFSSIEISRKTELKNLIDLYLKEFFKDNHIEISADNWFNYINENRIDMSEQEKKNKKSKKSKRSNGAEIPIIVSLEKKIKEDIEKGFLPKDRYDSLKNESLAFTKKLNVDDFIESMEKGKMSWIKRAAFCFFYKERLEQWLSENARSIEYKEKAQEYLTDISKLIKEIESIKTKQFDIERYYVKQYLYSKLNEQSKLKCKEENKSTEFVSVSNYSQKTRTYNIEGILDEIYGCGEKVNLFIDMQGGSRTSAFILNSILTMFGDKDADSNIQIKQIISVGYEIGNFANEIQDKTNDYRINKLVSGMNAFIKYGKAGILNDFFSKMEDNENSNDRLLLDYAVDIDNALSICDIDSLETNIMGLMNLLNNEDVRINDTYLRVVAKNIKKEYEKIQISNGSIDIPSLVKWAMDKEFYQQAMTIAEAKIPRHLVENNVIITADKANVQAGIDLLTDCYNREDAIKWQWNDLAYALMKNYWRILKTISNDGSIKTGLEIMKGLFGTGLVYKKYIKGLRQKSILDWYRLLCEERNKVNHSNNDESSGIETYITLIEQLFKCIDEQVEYSKKHQSENLFEEIEKGFSDKKEEIDIREQKDKENDTKDTIDQNIEEERQ